MMWWQDYYRSADPTVNRLIEFCGFISPLDLFKIHEFPTESL